MSNKLQQALALANKGFHVFPLVENMKLPLIDGWQRRATTDADRIKRWWVCPVMDIVHKYNVGICTTRFGKNKALIVIDVDNKNGRCGDNTIDKLIAEGKDFPKTLVVTTPTGGRHMYYSADEPVNQGSANVLGDGVDVRSKGGFVVGAYSEVPAGGYVSDDMPIKQAPEWLVNALENRSSQSFTKKNHSDIVIDDDLAMEQCLKIINDSADVTEGSRDMSAYALACRLRDQGLSESNNLHLMLHWNESHVIPPLENEEIEIKVASAYRTAKSPIGSKTPEADFTREDANHPSGHKSTPFVVEPLSDLKQQDIPPRRWLLGRTLVCNNITLLIAPPSMGKSTFSLLLALAVVTGKDKLTGLKVHERGNVLLINNEDDKNELYRRLYAIQSHNKIKLKDITDRLFLYSGVDRPFIVAKRQNGKIIPVDYEAVIKIINDKNIKLLVVDPFSETHGADENDNGQINQVARYYRSIAVRTGCAVLLIHHTRKPPTGTSIGHVGNMDSGRGASSLPGVARVVVTLYGMSTRDAKKYHIKESDKYLMVRMDDAKANLSLASSTASWFKKVSVKLFNGDDVGVLEPIVLADKGAEYDLEILRGILEILKKQTESEITLYKLCKELVNSVPDLKDNTKDYRVTYALVRRLLENPAEIDGSEIYLKSIDKPIKPRGPTNWICYRKIN